MLRNFQKLVVLFRALGFDAQVIDERESPGDSQIWVEIKTDNRLFQVWKFGYLVSGKMYPYEVHYYIDNELVDDTFVSSSEFDLIGLIYEVLNK